MLLSEILEDLETLKKEYQEIASQYGDVNYEDCTVHFGSTMWYDAFSQEMDTANPNGYTIQHIDKDFERVTQIVHEATKIFKANNLNQFLLEEDPSYWLGLLPEPYTSVY